MASRQDQQRPKPMIAVLGGTGQQGGGVVSALLDRGEFAVRVATRNPTGDAARELAARGVELVKADLEKHIAAANSLVPGGFIGFADWARLNMKQSPASARRGSQEA